MTFSIFNSNTFVLLIKLNIWANIFPHRGITWFKSDLSTSSTSVCAFGGMVVYIEHGKTLWFECVTMRWAVNEVKTGSCMHTNTCMQTFWVHLTICMLPIWFLLICVPVTPLLRPRFLPLCADVGGMMECWRVNLWFPGSCFGFIRSGCDNTPADGPTERLSYKRRSANKKPSWKK